MTKFSVKFKYAYNSQTLKKKLTEVGQIIEVETSGSKPTERDVVKALEKIHGTSNSSVTMWEVIE